MGIPPAAKPATAARPAIAAKPATTDEPKPATADEPTIAKPATTDEPKPATADEPTIAAKAAAVKYKEAEKNWAAEEYKAAVAASPSAVSARKTATLDEIRSILEDRLPTRDKLAALQPKGKDQIISALSYIVDEFVNLKDRNSEVAAQKIKTAINLLKQ